MMFLLKIIISRLVKNTLIYYNFVKFLISNINESIVLIS